MFLVERFEAEEIALLDSDGSLKDMDILHKELERKELVARAEANLANARPR